MYTYQFKSKLKSTLRRNNNNHQTFGFFGVLSSTYACVRDTELDASNWLQQFYYSYELWTKSFTYLTPGDNRQNKNTHGKIIFLFAAIVHIHYAEYAGIEKGTQEQLPQHTADLYKEGSLKIASEFFYCLVVAVNRNRLQTTTKNDANSSAEIEIKQ